MKANGLKPYMGYSGSPEEYGARLIFAHNAREAKKIGFGTVREWTESEWVDMRVKWLRKSPWLYNDADQGKLAKGEAHVIDHPTHCKICEEWGQELDCEGICSNCNNNEGEKE